VAERYSPPQESKYSCSCHVQPESLTQTRSPIDDSRWP
jgi:hypothetical protein